MRFTGAPAGQPAFCVAKNTPIAPERLLKVVDETLQMQGLEIVVHFDETSLLCTVENIQETQPKVKPNAD